MPDQPIPAVARRVVAITERGERMELRPITADDKPALVEGFERLSPASRRARFLRPVETLSTSQVTYLTEIDYVNHFAWVAELPGTDRGIGVSRYVRNTDRSAVAEMAVTVVDEAQGRGIGTLLTRALAVVAYDNGVSAFEAFMLADNTPMKLVLEHLGARVVADGPGLVIGRLELAPVAAAAEDLAGLLDVSRSLRAVGPLDRAG